MAMSVEQVNKKLERVLKELDSAIEDRDLAKVEKAIDKAQDLNKKSDANATYKEPLKDESQEETEGKMYEILLNQLEERIKNITNEIKPDNGLDTDERKELVNIRKKIREGKDPFEKTKTVVDSLSKKGINQEDLKNYKEQQKCDNTLQLNAIKENSKELASTIAYIEMNYIETIKKMDDSITVFEEIQKERNFLADLDPNTDVEIISATKLTIRNKLLKLEQIGLYDIDIQYFESLSLHEASNYIQKEIKKLRTKSNDKANKLASDKSIPENIKQRYGLKNAKNTAIALKDAYEGMVKTRKSMASKITTLEAENRQIDETIKTLNREEETKSIAYNNDGTKKQPLEIARTVLKNDREREYIEGKVSNVLDSQYGGFKGFKERFGARMRYYQETQKIGRFKAFWKALTNKTKTVKRIATISEATMLGRTYSILADNTMRKRQEDFKETLVNETIKKMSKDSTLTANQIREDVEEKAYGKALGEDEER